MADAYLLEAAHKAIRFVGRAGGEPACLVLVGDASQLRPVSGEGEMFTDFLAIHDAPTAVLDTVRRSGDEMSTMLERFREDTWKGEKWPRDVVERGDAEEVLDLFFDVLPENSLIVAYTNSRVMELNARGRIEKYGAERAAAEPYIVGERVISNSAVMDEGKVLLNNGQLGEIVRVEDAGEKGCYDIWLKVDEPINDTQAEGPVRVFCAVGIAAEFILARRSDAVEEAEGLFLEALTLCEDRRAVQKVISGRDKRDVEALAEASGPEIGPLILEMDQALRKATADFNTTKNRMADLRPTWACTVHKSQGISVENVIVDTSDIDKASEDWRPLAYVAMSRARNGITLI